MSKNPLYANEIATANKFILDHSFDLELKNFINEMIGKQYLTHSDRWSICYDWLSEHYPEDYKNIVTGFTYYLEN